MQTKELVFKQWLPINLDEAWAFFSSPKNLNKITPNDMSFEILSSNVDQMYPGQIIRYNIAPIAGIKMNWVTEITHVQDRLFFVDEQRFGPYAMWHHQHHFKPMNGGTEMIDILHYKVPFGIVGSIANALFVGNKVKQIFEFRKHKLNQLFANE